MDGKYQIGVYTLRAVEYGEELTFDYNSITEVLIISDNLQVFYFITLLHGLILSTSQFFRAKRSMRNLYACVAAMCVGEVT